MKKLLFLFLLIITALYGSSQTYTAVHNYQAQDGVNVIKSLGIPYGQDTTFALAPDSVYVSGVGGGYKKLMSLFYQEVDSTLYLHRNGKWVPVGSGTGSGSGIKITYLKFPLYAYNDSTIAEYHDDGLVTPASVTHLHDSTFYVNSGLVYWINGIQYTTGGDTVVLSGIDPSLPVKFLFVVDTTGHAGFLRGDPATIPLDPTPNPGEQLALTSGIVFQAGATEPDGIVTETIYNETAVSPEWAISHVGYMIMDSLNTDNPYSGTHDIFISKYAPLGGVNPVITFQKASVDTFHGDDVLQFAFYLNGKLGNTRLYFDLLKSGSYATQYIFLENGYVNKNDTNHYVLVTIPLNTLTWLNNGTFDAVRLGFLGTDTSGAKGLYTDKIILQHGINSVVPATDYSYKVDSSGNAKINDSTYVGWYAVKGVKHYSGDTIHVPSGGVGSSAWGAITGTLSDQTDLQSALDAKVNASDTAAMLSPYAKTSVVNTKLNISDTASMLSPYLKSIDSTNISNFSVKVRSLFGATSPIVYSNGTYSLDSNIVHTSLYNNSAYQGKLTITTTGTSGASTLSGNTLNIPQYSGGGGGSSNTVTEQKIYYRNEYVYGDTLNFSTGAIVPYPSDSTNISGYLHVAGGESITITSPLGYGNVTIYGWSYDTTLTPISEIRSNSLIGTQLSTYTFTTPSNARFIVIYVKYKRGRDFSKAIKINSTNTITYNIPITPEQFSGSKSVPVQSAVNFARFTSSPVVMTGSYVFDSTVYLSSGTHINCEGCKIQLDSASKTNIFRNEAVASPDTVFARGNVDIKIIGTGNAVIQGSKAAWGGGGASGVGSQYWRPIGVLMANVRNFEMSGITFLNTNMWAACLEQSRIFNIHDIKIYQDSSKSNQDGINIRRGSRDGYISNVQGVTWDDLIALTNLQSFPEYNILKSNYLPYDTALDIKNIVIKNIRRDTAGIFPSVTDNPPFFKSGILLLTEDGLKEHDIEIDGVTGAPQIQLGFTFYQYWLTTQATKNDMYNISISNTTNAKIAFGRPVKWVTLMNVAPTDSYGNSNALFVDGSLKVMRKYYNSNFQWYDSTYTGAFPSVGDSTAWIYGGNILLPLVPVNKYLGTRDSSSLRIITNNQIRLSIDSTLGRVGIGTTAPTFRLHVEEPTANTNVAGFFRSNMNNNSLAEILIGKSPSTTESYYMAYNYNSTVASSYFSIQPTSAAPGSASLSLNNNNVGIGTVSASDKLTVVPTASSGGITIIKPVAGSGSAGLITTTTDGGVSGWLWAYGPSAVVAPSGVLLASTKNLVIASSAAAGSGGNNSISFRPSGFFNTEEAMRIFSTKKVSIGDTTNDGSTLHIKGSVSFNYVAVSATYTVLATDYTVDCIGGGTFTVTLPISAGIAGRPYVITNSGAGTITVSAGSLTFTNVSGTPTSLTIAGYGTRTIQATSSNWLLLSSQ